MKIESNNSVNENKINTSKYYWAKWYVGVFLFLLLQILFFYFVTHFFTNYNYDGSY
jgi:hypothetical protein